MKVRRRSANVFSRVQHAHARFRCPATRHPLKHLDPDLCLAMEDSYDGVQSAWAAGMITVMVPGLPEPTEEMRGFWTLVVRDLHEVRELVLAAVPEPARQ